MAERAVNDVAREALTECLKRHAWAIKEASYDKGEAAQALVDLAATVGAVLDVE